jgi:hypothetical protein
MPSIVERLQRRVDIYALKLETARTLQQGLAESANDVLDAELELIDAQLLLDRELEAIADKAKKSVPPQHEEEVPESQRMSDSLNRKFRALNANSVPQMQLNREIEAMQRNRAPAHANHPQRTGYGGMPIQPHLPKQGGHATYGDPVPNEGNEPLVFSQEDFSSAGPTGPIGCISFTGPTGQSGHDQPGGTNGIKCNKDERCTMPVGHEGACGWQEINEHGNGIVVRANIVPRCHTQACVKRKGHLDDCQSSTGQLLGSPAFSETTSRGTLDHSDSL